MTNQELKEYVKLAYEMEQEVFLQKEAIKRAEQKYTDLSKGLPKPVSQASFGEALANGFNLSGALIGLALFFSFLALIFQNTKAIFVFALLIVLCLLGIPVGIIFSFIDDYSKRQKHSQNMVEYQNALERQGAEKNALTVQITEWKRLCEKSESNLKKLYSYNVIYPKYQNLIAVSSFYDYLYSGSCSTLEGPHGAYNKFDVEVRLDKIITKMDVIIQQLNTIQTNQFMLYQAINNSNKTIDNLSRALDSGLSRLGNGISNLSKQSEIAAYEAERTRKELEYRNRMDRIYHRWY